METHGGVQKAELCTSADQLPILTRLLPKLPANREKTVSTKLL
jgi:hypothetical protein